MAVWAMLSSRYRSFFITDFLLGQADSPPAADPLLEARILRLGPRRSATSCQVFLLRAEFKGSDSHETRRDSTLDARLPCSVLDWQIA